MKNIIFAFLLTLSIAHAEVNTAVYNITDNTTVSGTLNQREMSIASISKLMTVYTILASNLDLSETVTVESTLHNHTKLKVGMQLTRKELVEMALVASDNLAAMTLADTYPGGRSQFVFMMNSNATQLGMNSTKFVEPTGLSPMNISTLEDISILTQVVSEYSAIRTAAQTDSVKTTLEINNRTRQVVSKPTSRYFGKDGIVAIKTGFTKAAGYCITILVKSNERMYNIVVLGAKTPAEREKMVQQGMKNINKENL